ncbi:hypothetical protein ACI7YU_21165 [Pseudomonas siliginis]|uniref:hypothetical protein n=1 Tax=Pseudomonas siliginis TaxID=2842346 RepID=UPI003869DC00
MPYSTETYMPRFSYPINGSVKDSQKKRNQSKKMKQARLITQFLLKEEMPKILTLLKQRILKASGALNA